MLKSSYQIMSKRRISKAKNRPTPFLTGDSLIEIMFAVGMFGLVGIGAIGIMNRGLYDSQRALEISMARNEIDAQAEALRFIREAYISEKNIDPNDRLYTGVWEALTNSANVYNSNAANRELPEHFVSAYTANSSCNSVYTSDAVPEESFVVNMHRLDGEIIASTTCKRGASGNCVLVKKQSSSIKALEVSPVYPRILYGTPTYTVGEYNPNSELTDNTTEGNTIQSSSDHLNVQKAQGIWITTVASSDDAIPEYYDFYIRTCWNAPGINTPAIISSIIRLYNPNYSVVTAP